MELVNCGLDRPLPKVVKVNMMSKEFLSSIKLKDIKREVNLISYNSDENIEEFTVNSALEIKDSVLEHIKKCINTDKKINAFIDAEMNTGKTLLQKHLNKHMRDISKDTVVIHLAGNNSLNYSILHDNVLKDNKGNVIETIEFDKFFKGEDKESIKFEKINCDSAITNFNNFFKLLELLESLNRKYIILFDECHMFISEFLFRNSEIKTNGSDEEFEQIMDMFQEGMNKVLSQGNENSLGALWFTATPDSFEGCDLRFSKVFRLYLKDEYRVKTSLLKPVQIAGKTLVSRLSYIIKCLEEGPEDLLLSIFLNRKKDIDNLVPCLKSYMKMVKNYKDEEVEKMIAVFYRNDTKKNTKNEVLEGVIKDSTIPSHVRIIFSTSYVNVGLEMIEEARPVDIVIFVIKETFSLIGEIQYCGRFRRGIRMIHMVATEFTGRKLISYERFLKYKKKELEKQCKALIDVIKITAKSNEISLRNAKRLFDTNDIRTGIQCISIKNNKCCINKMSLLNTAFLLYQRDYTLSSFDSLIDAFCNHRTMHIENIAENTVIDYSNKTLEDLGIVKEKKEKSSTAKDTNNAIKNINKLINEENKGYIRKALRTGDISYLDYNIEVEDDYGETSLLIVDNSKIKKELSIILNSNRYKNAFGLFKEGEKNIGYNEDIIDKILDLKIKNPYFSDKKKEQKVITVNTAYYDAPVLKQNKVKNEIKKVINAADFMIDSKLALLNTSKLSDYKNVNGTRLTEKIKIELFENLMYSGAAELEFSRIIERLNKDSQSNKENINENNKKIKSLKTEWNLDGTPLTKYDKKNSYHNNLILKVVKLYFNISKIKTGYVISSAKDSYKIQ